MPAELVSSESIPGTKAVSRISFSNILFYPFLPTLLAGSAARSRLLNARLADRLVFPIERCGEISWKPVTPLCLL